MTRPLCVCAAVLAAAVLGTACGGKATAPSATTPPVAAPTATEVFNGTLPVGGTKFYSFTVGVNGTVNVTLVSVGGAGVAPDVTLNLGLGRPAGTGCVTSSAVNAQAGAAAQLTGTYAPAVYCVNLADVGNLSSPATFGITIAHP